MALLMPPDLRGLPALVAHHFCLSTQPLERRAKEDHCNMGLSPWRGVVTPITQRGSAACPRAGKGCGRAQKRAHPSGARADQINSSSAPKYLFRGEEDGDKTNL